MFQIQRLNMDSSWHVQWNSQKFLVDPWLIGSEIDGFTWLNEQLHTTDPISVNDLPEYSFTVISQSYEDHCHTPTLQSLEYSKPILATGKAFLKLKKTFPKRQVIQIPDITRGECLYYNDLGFWAIRPKKWLDPIYYALLVFNSEREGVFYASHGFELDSKQIQKLKDFNIKVLITTFIDFKLPAILGGHVNPGLDNAKMLADTLQPNFVFNTHDEDKIAKGLVGKLANIKLPDFDEARQIPSINFKETSDYKPLRLDF